MRQRAIDSYFSAHVCVCVCVRALLLSFFSFFSFLVVVLTGKREADTE